MKQIERQAERTRERNFDAVRVRHRNDDLAGMGLAEPPDSVGEARLELHERLAPGEAKARRPVLNGLPLRELAQLWKRLTSPAPEVALDKAAFGDDGLSHTTGDGRSRLARALERRGIDGRHRRSRERLAGLRRLIQTLVRQVQAPCTTRKHLSGRCRSPMSDKAHHRGAGRFAASCRHDRHRSLWLVRSADRSLERIGSEVAGCSLCPRLVAWRRDAASHPPISHASERYWARPLAGFGDPDARLVVVGLAPAAHGGNRTGRMFTGDRSGDFLFAALHRAGYANQPLSRSLDDGLELSRAWVTAAVRCAPPANKPTPLERDTCGGYLSSELRALAGARVLLALGAFAYEALWRLPEAGGGPGEKRERFAHGLELPLPPLQAPRLEGRGRARDQAPRTLLCSYHPSQRNVFTGLLTAEMFDKLLARARQLGA